jgi:hypothetical protein
VMPRPGSVSFLLQPSAVAGLLTPRGSQRDMGAQGCGILMARLREARLSKDVDIATKESLDAAERVLREAAAANTGDFL